MHVITARNVNGAYRSGLRFIVQDGEKEETPNGAVLRASTSVATVFRHPQERVLMSPQRNANPFFHLFEALWMLSGQQDVMMLRQFADESVVVHSAFGHRWRNWPSPEPYGNAVNSFDQLNFVIRALRKNPSDRRVVVGMWDPRRDLNENCEVPENLTIKVGIAHGKLNMIAFNRSSDVIQGCYGANAVHLSMLQEYLAACINVAVGTLTQISTDYHVYLDRPYFLSEYFPLVDEHLTIHEPYADMMVYPLVHAPDVFDEELAAFMSFIADDSLYRADRIAIVQAFRNKFLWAVALPMYLAHIYIRQRDYPNALQVLITEHEHYLHPLPIDWICACAAWIERRMREAGIKVVK